WTLLEGGIGSDKAFSGSGIVDAFESRGKRGAFRLLADSTRPPYHPRSSAPHLPALRIPEQDRRGRDGGGLPGARVLRERERGDGGGETDPSPPLGQSGFPEDVRRRGAHRVELEAPEHRADARP